MRSSGAEGLERGVGVRMLRRRCRRRSVRGLARPSPSPPSPPRRLLQREPACLLALPRDSLGAAGSNVLTMLSRTPALVLCSSGLVPFSPAPSPAQKCTTSCRHAPSSNHLHLHLHPRPPRHLRTFAQHAHCEEPDLSWPEAVHPHSAPTPYQILRCERGQVYTKHRFYSLVKLYHPDRGGASSPTAHLPSQVRLERYRLLVAAHSILSDDAKRRAYDAWGHGWAGHHRTPTHPSQYKWAHEERQWPPGHDPRYNATWEDWERWYQREDGSEKADPRDMYMSNFAFVSLVFAIVTLGGVMQGTRASIFTSTAMEQRDRIHKEASMELARSKRATISGDRNERIKTFLEHREAVMAGEVAYQRALPPPETCSPDTVRKQ